jgi:UDP-N-acetylglucosamine 4,6-dehydratase
MISETDARHTVDVGKHYVIEPEMEWWGNDRIQGQRLSEGFCYRSDTNDWWLSADELRGMLGLD